MLETEMLVEAKILGENGQPRTFSDPKSLLKKVAELVLAYNALVGNANKPNGWKKEATEILDQIMVESGTWMISKPPNCTYKNGKKVEVKEEADRTNPKRWDALANLNEQIAGQLEMLKANLLTGPTDFRKISLEQKCYWLERLDPQHRSGTQLAQWYHAWLGLGPNTSQSFFGYIKNVERDILGGNGIKSVEYIQRASRRRKYELTLNPNGQAGDFLGPDGNLFSTKDHSTHFSGKGWAIFVCSRETKRVFAASHKVDEFHHSSFLSGQPVLAAGEIVISNGEVYAITAKSGHYKPTPEDMQNFLKEYDGSCYSNRVIRPAHEEPPEAFNLQDYRDNGLKAKKLKRADVLGRIPIWARTPKDNWVERIPE